MKILTKLPGVWMGALGFLTVAAAGTLMAESGARDSIGFRPNQIYTEVSVAASGTATGATSYYVKDLLEVRNLYIAARSTNNNARTLALYSLAGRPKATAATGNGRVALEYGLRAHFGLGYSLESTSVRVYDAPLTSTYGLAPTYLLALPGVPSTTGGPGFTEIANALTTDVQIARINTANFEMAVHGAFGRFDPYARLTLGLGGFGSITLHAGLSAGFRLYRSPSFYFFAEAYGNYYRVQQNSGGGGSSDEGSSGGGSESVARGPARRAAVDGIVEKQLSARISRISESSARFGIGYVY